MAAYDEYSLRINEVPCFSTHTDIKEKRHLLFLPLKDFVVIFGSIQTEVGNICAFLTRAKIPDVLLNLGQGKC